MADPIWLNRERIDFIHEQAIEMAGGSHGLRDSGLLDSAIARPRNLHAYGENDIFQLAASYAEAISQNHPFVDGNKRVAFEASARFLSINGFELEVAKGDEHADMIESLAQGKTTRDEAARYLRDNSRSRDRGSDEQKQTRREALKERLQKQREQDTGRTRSRPR